MPNAAARRRRSRRQSAASVSVREAERAERNAVYDIKYVAIHMLKMAFFSFMMAMQIYDFGTDAFAETGYFYAIYHGDSGVQNMGNVFNVVYGLHAVISFQYSVVTVTKLYEAMSLLNAQRRRRFARAGSSDGNRSDAERSRREALLARAATQLDIHSSQRREAATGVGSRSGETDQHEVNEKQASPLSQRRARAASLVHPPVKESAILPTERRPAPIAFQSR